ncbi:helix-hairpin-helix DNA-binding motif-containing protein [Pandoraea capi]|uniref:Helix-hairpin-helix DNA-binding motif-containing protein n=1 Tax=Pandoraea capi TaxID=2508286 RepID=A0ABY6VVZ8_9BURK|nr:helix-hairpin-helix DNA-binding motif-containing protein [Pandoraea capi]
MQTNPLALFGDHLARLRKARGWSQEKLALESGLARSYVSGIERGRRNVALVNICVLADTLGVPTSEMLRFAQASAGAEDVAMQSERTPLPQISRSLCKLENRDQVWLAEIIRSLSSRLSHATPPAGAGVSADAHEQPSGDAHQPTFAEDRSAFDTLCDGDEADATGDDADTDADEANERRMTTDTGLPRPPYDGSPARTPVRPDFESGFPTNRLLATSAPSQMSAQASYAASAPHSDTETARPSATVDASGAVGKVTPIGDPMNARGASSDAPRQSTSEGRSHDDTLRMRRNDDE